MAIIGVDEVGRGSWAGPLLVVAAKCAGQLPDDLRDSKVLNKRTRQNIYARLKNTCSFGEGWVDPKEIDKLGLTAAMTMGVNRALTSVGAMFEDEIIIDGNYNYCDKQFLRSRCVIKADGLIPIVSAASVYAKVIRDSYMERAAKLYPEYGFDKHVGYGTTLHREALKEFGVTPMHRQSYKPVSLLLNNNE